jgi:hypothetical protein
MGAANTQNESKNLRGVSETGWEILDTSCLGDTSNDLDAEKESCGTRNDKAGNSCIWCDGAGVLGYCVSPAQKNVLGNYMECDDLAKPFAAVQ